MEQYLWLPVKIKEMISYIGFVTYSVSDNDIKIVRNNYLSSSNQKWMVCSAGGGKKGEEFINLLNYKIYKHYNFRFLNKLLLSLQFLFHHLKLKYSSSLPLFLY